MRAPFSNLMTSVCVGAIISLTACDDPQWLRDIHNGFDKTRAQSRAAEVRTSVIPLLEKYGHAQDLTAIPSSEIPEEIYSLPLFAGSSTNDIHAFVSHTDEIMFTTGSGFGHWGIIVCKTAATRIANPVDKHKVRLWEDGVFFYSEYR